MRTLLLTLAACALAAGTASLAEAEDYPWCAIYDMGDEAKNCGFVTIEQCRASVSGIGGFCMRDPQYEPPPSAAVPQRPRSFYSHRQS